MNYKQGSLYVILLALISFIMGCSAVVNPELESEVAPRTFIQSRATTITDPYTHIFVGQTMDVGYVLISNTANTITLEVVLTGDYMLKEYHLELAAMLDDIPQTKTGNPIPGKFTYSGMYTEDMEPFVFTFGYEGADFNFVPNQRIFIAFHGVYEDKCTGQTETGWLGCQEYKPFDGRNWATYTKHTLTVPDVDQGE